MRVGFFTVFRRDPVHYVLARVLLASVREQMPGVEVAMLTDETSPPLPGVDEVRRLPAGKMLERRLEHYAGCEGDWLLVDTDVTIRADVRDVFDRPFAVAVADRHWTHIKPTPELTAEMPFNTGVVFSRSPAFWREVLRTWRSFSAEGQADWMSEQRAFAQVVRGYVDDPRGFRARPRVLVLPGMVYNYPPSGPDDAGLVGAKIAHYKGPRKQQMLGPSLLVKRGVPAPQLVAR